MDNEQADAGRDDRTRLARPNSQARTGTGESIFLCSADHEQDWQPYPDDPYSALSADHAYIHIYMFVCFYFPFILDVKFVGCTSRGHTGGRSHIISHPPSLCGACLYFSRAKDSVVPFSRQP